MLIFGHSDLLDHILINFGKGCILSLIDARLPHYVCTLLILVDLLLLLLILYHVDILRVEIQIHMNSWVHLLHLLQFIKHILDRLQFYVYGTINYIITSFLCHLYRDVDRSGWEHYLQIEFVRLSKLQVFGAHSSYQPMIASLDPIYVVL